MFIRKNFSLLNILLVLLLIVGFTISTFAQENVKIGVLYPLTGPIANSGRNCLNAVELAVSIINEEHPELSLDLAPTAGLPNLNGAKIELVTGNTQSEPEYAKADAERLITMEKVCALLGSYESGTTKPSSQVAEKYGTPYITGISTSAALTERGYKYFFRTTQTINEEVIGVMAILKSLNEEKNANIKTIGMIFCNTENGMSNHDKMEKALKENGNFEIVSDITFPLGITDFESEVLLLKQADPDMVISTFVTPDLILFINTCKKINYMPKGYIGIDMTLPEPEFLDTVGEDGNFLITKNVFALDLMDKNPLLKKVNEMYHNAYGANLDGNNIRAFTAMMTLADAINRAGSTDKEAIRKALVETDISPDQLIVMWEGVKFDETGQNVLATPIFQQMLDEKLVTIWPFEVASLEVVYPLPKWEER